jgi:ATP-binding cassette subfamily B multidrug efflux pump
VSYEYAGSGEESLTDITFDSYPRDRPLASLAAPEAANRLDESDSTFYDASKGEVSVDGINVKDYAEHESDGSLIGIVPQKAVLFQRNHP